MLLFIPFLTFMSVCYCQNYVPGLTRQPSSFLRPPLFRFKRPPPKNYNMDASPSEDTTSRLSHPASEPFIPGATAFMGRPTESVQDFSLNHRPHYNSFEFSSSQEDRNPILNVATDEENLLPHSEESSLSGPPQEVTDEIIPSSAEASYVDRPSETEISPYEEHPEREDVFVHPSEMQDINSNESIFPQEMNEDNENEQFEHVETDEIPVNMPEENVEFRENNDHETNEETQHSNMNEEHVFEENYANSPAEHHPNEDENNEQDEASESRTTNDEYKVYENFPSEEVSDIIIQEGPVNENTETSQSYNPPMEHKFAEGLNEIGHINSQSEENIFQLDQNSFEQEEEKQKEHDFSKRPFEQAEEIPKEREFSSRPSFSMRPSRFHQREQYERQPSFESPKQETPPIDRQDYQTRPTRYQYPSFDENSLHKAESFSDTPSRIISSPKIKNHKNQESKKRRRPYKPFLETTPSPYEDENTLPDYPMYEDESENKEPDRLTVLLQQTKFNCLEKNDGYYADESLGCEVFHFCQDKVRHSWLCPSGASFHQVHLICMPQSDDNICEKSSNFHFVNDYLYKEAPESTGRNRSYVQRYYPKGYEGGIAVLEERESISQNPSLHQVSPYEREQYRTSIQRNPPRNYHPQHSVQSHEVVPFRRQEQEDVSVYNPRPNPPPQEDRYHNRPQHYEVNPSLTTRQESIPFANNPTQGHIRRPQELYPRPGAAFLVNEQETGLVKRAPSFYRRLGPY